MHLFKYSSLCNHEADSIIIPKKRSKFKYRKFIIFTAISVLLAINLSFPIIITNFDFETPQGWTTGGDGGYSPQPWARGAPTSGPMDDNSGGGSCWGTVLASGYSDCGIIYRAEIVSPSINVSGKVNLSLEFYYWMDSELTTSTYDGGNIKISTNNGVTWQNFNGGTDFTVNVDAYINPPYDGTINLTWQNPIEGEYAYGYDTGGWVQVNIDLSVFDGASSMLIKFDFGVEETSTGDAGWYIDDVTLTSTVPLGATNLTKNTGHISIQDAIDNANPGNQIMVYNGTNNGQINVTKPVYLVSEGWYSSGVNKQTVLNGAAADSAVFINTGGVIIEGFTVKGGEAGILVTNMTGSYQEYQIRNNIIRNNGVHGIRFNETFTTENTIIENNIISSNGDGRADNIVGLYFFSYLTGDNSPVIRNNVFDQNTFNDGAFFNYAVIFQTGSGTKISFPQIYSNNFKNHDYPDGNCDGIELYGYERADISHNIFDNCDNAVSFWYADLAESRIMNNQFKNISHTAVVASNITTAGTMIAFNTFENATIGISSIAAGNIDYNSMKNVTKPYMSGTSGGANKISTSDHGFMDEANLDFSYYFESVNNGSAPDRTSPGFNSEAITPVDTTTSANTQHKLHLFLSKAITPGDTVTITYPGGFNCTATGNISGAGNVVTISGTNLAKMQPLTILIPNMKNINVGSMQEFTATIELPWMTRKISEFQITLPMSAGPLNYFEITHAGSSLINNWSLVSIRACDPVGNTKTNYFGDVILNIPGAISYFDWTTNISAKGVFWDNIPDENGARYQFVLSDMGIVNLLVKGDMDQIVNINASNLGGKTDNDLEGNFTLTRQGPYTNHWDFEDGKVPPDDWTTQNTGNPANAGWVITSIGANSGIYSLYHQFETSAPSSEAWVISHKITNITADTVLEFYEKTAYTADYSNHSLFISTATSDLGDFVFVQEFNGKSMSWVKRSVSMAPYVGQNIFFAYRYQGENADSWWIDDIKVYEPPMVATNMKVGGIEYVSIQAAIDAAAIGDTIMVYTGTHY